MVSGVEWTMVESLYAGNIDGGRDCCLVDGHDGREQRVAVIRIWIDSCL
jgi:hypothetical protein